jgi:hypothetical protein
VLSKKRLIEMCSSLFFITYYSAKFMEFMLSKETESIDGYKNLLNG